MIVLFQIHHGQEFRGRMHRYWIVVVVQAYLFQLLLNCPLQLSDMAKLGGILLSKGSACLLGCALLGRQRFLGLAVSDDLVLQQTLLHLQEPLCLSKPFFILPPLRLVCRRCHVFYFRLQMLIKKQNDTY